MWDRNQETEPPAPPVDRRLSARYRVSTPVKLMLDDGERLLLSTRDISASGFFVYVDKHVPVVDRLQFIVTFPPETTTACKLLALCNGVVVRREVGDTHDGLAIKIEHYEFLSTVS